MEGLVLQLLLEGFALRDVVDGSDHLQGLALVIADDLGPAVDHPYLSIRPDYPVLEVVGLVLAERAVDLLPEQLPVIGVDHLREPLEAWNELPRLEAVDAEDLVRPPHLAGPCLPLPVAEVGHALRLRQAGLAPAQSLLVLLAPGDVAGDDEDRVLQHRRDGSLE